VKILADVEERRSSVPECLRSQGVAVEIVRLPVGDYVLSSHVAVERKTVSDLHRALVTGRLWSQVAALTHDFGTPYLIVEGRDLDSARGLSSRGVRGALLQVLDSGIRLIRTDGPGDTAIWLRLMGVRMRSADGRTVWRRGRRRMAVSPAGVLATIPGVSPESARRLVERFGCIAAIAAASEAELREVTGIGAVRAETLARVLRGSAALQLGAPSSRSASPEVPASLARIGRYRGT